MENAEPKPILIAGPTASGKSALALALAERFGGVVINADSMQVYRELRILTSRPTPEDEARVPHALYGFVPACEAYSAGRFVSDAAAAIAAALNTGRRPVIVGGTGLYLKALLEGLSPIPPIAEDVRAHWRTEADRRGAEELHGELAKRDAVMAARLALTDTQRIVRALEVIDQTGRSLADWQRARAEPVVDEAQAARLVLSIDRTELHARADARFDGMMEAGALAEAEALAELRLDAALPAMRAIGVRPLIAAIKGETPLDEAIAAAKLETRQYIKRQQTWLSKHMIAWNCISTKQMESLEKEIVSFIQSQS